MPLQQKKAATLQINSQQKKAEAAANSGKSLPATWFICRPFQRRFTTCKLAILGVSSKVVESQNGDKTIYRVQSNTMQQEAAVKLQNLQDHNINSLIRSAK